MFRREIAIRREFFRWYVIEHEVVLMHTTTLGCVSFPLNLGYTIKAGPFWRKRTAAAFAKLFR